MTTMLRYHTTMGLICTLGAVWALAALLIVICCVLVAFGGFWGAAVAWLILGVGLRVLFHPFIKKHK
jgi:membrane protein implicated in regulation of membrane protease activity